MDEIRRRVLAVVYEYMGRTGIVAVNFLGKCLVALLVLLIGFKIAGSIVKMCDRAFGRSRMDETLHTFLISFLKIGLKIIVIFIAVTELGVAASSIVAIVGSAGLALGLSIQGSLANIAGGVVLLFVKPFQVGDYIIEESSGKEGTVEAVGMMYTKLLSVDNKVILIPNGNLANASITNVTHQEKRRVDLTIGIEYNEDIKKVRTLLSQVIEEEEVLLKDEPIQIFVSEFKDSCVDMGVRYWVKTEDYWTSRWRVLENIKYKFDENNVSIPFNQLDVNLVAPAPENKAQGS